jgi:hypothetical protein
MAFHVENVNSAITHKQLLKLHLRIPKMLSNLPQKWWNGTNDCPNPCINRVYLLQWRIHKCVQNKIRSCKPSCQAISLHKPCQFFVCLVPVSTSQLSAFQTKVEYTSIKCKEKARTFQASKAVPATPTLVAHMAACAGLMRPDGRGRRIVLFILASFFISNT